MSKIDLNALRDRAYKNACEHGFHDEELSNEHCFCLVISELMEAVEADRKNRHFDKEKYKIGEYAECQGWLTNEEKFINVFNRYIKDTIEDELSDAVIRLLDLAGLHNIELSIMDLNSDTIDDMAEACKDESFTETMYSISTLPVRYDGLYDFTTIINDMVTSIFGFAKHLNIDLLWHVKQKMKYNELREKMHGKKC